MNAIVISEFEQEGAFETIDLEAIERVALFALEQENAPAASEVSIALVDANTIANLNSEYREKEGPTDVLSFECDSIDDEPSMLEDGESVLMLGDIVIAPEIAQNQAVEYGVTLEQELALLTIHGVLHLLGYDHIEDEDAAVMEPREDELLKMWQVQR